MEKKTRQTENSSLATLSRRQFLQATAATCLAASMMTACSGGDSQDDTFVPDNNDLDFKEGTWHKSFCGSCIWTNCGTEIKVQNGVAIELRGNKDHPSNRGSLCPRGTAMLANIYNPYRVKVPMKRTKNFGADKGFTADPGWQEITWDEAMNIVYEKLGAIFDSNNPQAGFSKMCMVQGFSRNGHEGPLGEVLFGGALFLSSAGPLCDVHHAPGMFNTSFVDRVDVGSCDYAIKIGRNMADNNMYGSGCSRGVADALDRGMKIISVDPHCGVGESKNGEWVPIKPATDMAFLMGLLHVMLWEDGEGNLLPADLKADPALDKAAYDIDALRWRSNAPYLVYCYPEGHPLHDLDGSYVREGDDSLYDFTVDPAVPLPGTDILTEIVNVDRKPMIMGTDDNPYTYADFDGKQPAAGVNPDFLYDARDVNGNGITTAFVLLRESVSEDKGKLLADDGTPLIGTTGGGKIMKFLDVVAERTGLPVDQIRRIANEFVEASTVSRVTKTGAEPVEIDGYKYPKRPAAISVGRGTANQVQGQRSYIVANIINTVLGAIGVPGTTVVASSPIFEFEDGMCRPPSLKGGTPLQSGTLGLLNTFANRTFDFAGNDYYPTSTTMPGVLGLGYQTIIDPAKFGFDYDIEVLFASGCNPFKANSSQELVIRAWKKVPFIFNFCIDFDESVMFSDLLLPEHSQYERVQTRMINDTMIVDQNNIRLRGMQYKEPAINLLYDTRQYEELVFDIFNHFGVAEQLLQTFVMTQAERHTPYESPVRPAAMDLDTTKKYTYKELCDIYLKAIADGRGIEWFKENGFYMFNTPHHLCYEYFTLQKDMVRYTDAQWKEIVDTEIPAQAPGGSPMKPYAHYSKTGRIPVYNYKDFMNGKYFKKVFDGYTLEGETVAPFINALGQNAIPGWNPNHMYRVLREFPAVPSWYDFYMVKPSLNDGVPNDAGVNTFWDNEYDMFAVNWKITIRNLSLGGQDANPWLNEIRSTCDFDDWRIQMHPATAAVKGIQDGDSIKVTSQSSGATVSGKVKLTNLIQKDCLGFPAIGGHISSGWAPFVRQGTDYNALLSSLEGWILPDGGVICNSVRVKIEKA